MPNTTRRASPTMPPIDESSEERAKPRRKRPDMVGEPPTPTPPPPPFTESVRDEADSLSSLERALLDQQAKMFNHMITSSDANTKAFLGKIDEIRKDVRWGGFFMGVVVVVLFLVMLFIIAEMNGVDSGRVAGATSSVVQSAGEAASKLNGNPPAPQPAPSPLQTHPAIVPHEPRGIETSAETAPSAPPPEM
jgi:hypothetical protein